MAIRIKNYIIKNPQFDKLRSVSTHYFVRAFVICFSIGYKLLEATDLTLKIPNDRRRDKIQTKESVNKISSSFSLIKSARLNLIAQIFSFPTPWFKNSRSIIFNFHKNSLVDST